MVAMIPRQLPIVQIRQTYAKIGIDADLGKQSIQQPRPTYEMQYQRPVQTMESPRGQMTINSQKAWDAMGRGGHLETMTRIYSQGPQIALETIGKIADEGDQLAAIHKGGGDMIAALAQDIRLEFGQYRFEGPAAFDNVDIMYQASKANIQVQDGKVHVNARVNPPIHEYTRGNLDIYMQQYNKVEFTPPPPQIDVTV